MKKHDSRMLMLLAASVISTSLCCGCAATKSTERSAAVTIREKSHDTVTVSDIRYDSVYVYQERFRDRSRDTVYVNDVSVTYKYRMLHDTLRLVTRDSIPYEVRVTQVREVPRRRGAIDVAAYCCLGLVAGMLIFKLARFL